MQDGSHCLSAVAIVDRCQPPELAKGMIGKKVMQEPQYFRGRDAEDYVPARW